MSSGADAADQIVNMSLRGIEVLAKIGGTGAKNLAVFLYAVLKGQKKTKGRTRLEGLLRSGKELKVFAVKNEDLQKFTQEAKRYGVLYCALRDKKSIDGMCDVMVRVEDASKIDRIVERFKLATVDTATIKTEIQKLKAEKAPSEKGTPAEKSTDDFLDELMSKPEKSEPESPQNDNSNPTMATAAKSRPSEPTYERNANYGEAGTIEPERRSVRQELKEIRESRKEKAATKREPARDKSRTNQQTAKQNRPKAKTKTPKAKER
jgi:hypothetical protein